MYFLLKLGKIFERITFQELLQQSYVNSRSDQLNYYVLLGKKSKIIYLLLIALYSKDLDPAG